MKFLYSNLIFGVLILIESIYGVPLTKFVGRSETGSYLGFDYASEKVRGVNLGGWFVLEPYINLSLFQAFGADDSNIPVDEYHYTQWLGKQEASNRLQQHWSTWYTEEDFKDIANYGLNHVRIPIGYWAFNPLPDDPYVQGQEEYLDNAITWARNAGLKVWIDLHGAPGSQNGFDNSGLRGSIGWQQGGNVQKTLDTLYYLAQKYGGVDYNDVVTSIELLNEPLGPELDMDQVKEFFQNGFDTVRNAGSNTGVVFHDSFQPLNYYDNFLTLPDYWYVILDHHQYQVFSPGELSRSVADHIGVACEIGRQSQSEYHWRVTGEWSAALTDCAQWLNGVGNGARYDGSFPNSYYIDTCENRWNFFTWSPQDIQDTRQYVEAQMEAYDQGTGWIFWCYKTENSLEWDFRRLVDYGLFPFPFDDRHYPNTCGFN